MQGTIKPLKLFQTLAILEILHAGFGLVRAPVMTTGGAAIIERTVHTLALHHLQVNRNPPEVTLT